MRVHINIRIVIATLSVLCAVLAQAAEDPLPSWNDNPTKRAIIDFVTKVTDKNGNSFVPASDRIATLDNDGTLWTEKPLYTHFYGVLAQMKAQMSGDPFLNTREPYRSVAKASPFTYSPLTRLPSSGSSPRISMGFLPNESRARRCEVSLLSRRKSPSWFEATAFSI